MSAEDLIGVYGDSYDALRLGTGTFVEQLWLDLGGPDDRRAKAFADAALEVVNAAAGEVAVLVDTYVAEYAATTSARPARGDLAVDLADYVVGELRGGLTNALDVYRRPAITARAALADGKPFDQAMAEAGRRARGQAAADVGLAHRQAGRDAMRATPGVDGYRRTLTGASCSLCRVASTQRYSTGELMPIHTHCDCRIAPIVDGYDGGRIVNRELYRELKASGELDRLNRRNAGTSGQSRARAAQARRERRSAQASLDGTQTALDVSPPPPSPVVRNHGELGPVLADERHTFTAAKRSTGGAVDDAGDLRRQAPTVDDDVAPDPPAPPDATPKPARPPRFTPDSPAVIRAAQRRNISPEAMAAELEAKRARRIADQAAERAEARDLTVDSPAVREVADRYGVTPDEVMVARSQVPEVRRTIADAATRVQLETFEALDHGQAVAVGRPPRAGKRTAFGRRARGGEYDWLEGLDPKERDRLSKRWYTDAPDQGVDVVAAQARSFGAIPFESTDDEFIEWWLDLNRRHEAAGAIRRGRLPSARAYSGAIDVDDVVQVDGYRAGAIVGRTDLEAAGHIAQANRELARAEALDYLGPAANPAAGRSSPYRMSFQSWEAEVRDLEYGLRNTPGELPADAWDRYAELVPQYLDEPGTSFEELYTRIVTTARLAGEDIPANAVIPWADDVAPAIIPPDEFL